MYALAWIWCVAGATALIAAVMRGGTGQAMLALLLFGGAVWTTCRLEEARREREER